QHLTGGVDPHPDFPAFILRRALGAECVELVEQMDGRRLPDRIEDHAELCRRRAEIFGDQAVELDRKECEPKLASERGSRNGFSSAGRANEKEFTEGGEAVLVDAATAPLLDQHPLNPCAYALVQ